MKRNQWYPIKNQSLAVYARNAGFDISVYDHYSKPVKKELKERSIKEALKEIKTACDDEGFDITAIKQGVYIISLSAPLSIRYPSKKCSQTIYIGMGSIISRIKGQFERNLFDFMQSLSGANFDFYFAHPGLKSAGMYYKHVEYLMLEHFRKQYGQLPILNKNAGAKKNYNRVVVGGKNISSHQEKNLFGN